MPRKVDAEVEHRQLIFFVIKSIVLFRVSPFFPTLSVLFFKIDLSKHFFAVLITKTHFKEKRILMKL